MNKYMVLIVGLGFLAMGSCAQESSKETISAKSSSAYSCGIDVMFFKASINKTKDSFLRLSLHDFELSSSRSEDMPFLDLQDLMAKPTKLLFESTDSDQLGLFHTWQLLQIEQQQTSISTRSIAKDILGTKNLHVSLVRISFNKNSQTAQQQEEKSHEHSDHDHAHEDGKNEADHEGKTREQEIEGPSISFGVFQQLRGQQKPSWCAVTAPIEIEEEEGTYYIQVLESARGETKIDAEGSHQSGHGHDH